MPQNAAKSMTTSSQVASFQVPPEPFKDHLWMSDRLQKQATGKTD